MSVKRSLKNKLIIKRGILGARSGSMGGLVFQKNGVIRASRLHIKRK